MACAHDLAPILLMTPANAPERLHEIGRQASGFVYCLGRKGVTGKKTDLSQGVAEFVGRCRMATSLPLALGFGIRTPADVRALRGLVDIAIVGTACLEVWEERGPDAYREFMHALAVESVRRSA
jgi:tryptophan synthase alpha chain